MILTVHKRNTVLLLWISLLVYSGNTV